MSVPVDVDDLASRVEEYGRTPFLVTTGDDARPHTTHVVVAYDDGILRCAAGRRTAANAGARPLVALLWPAVESGGYSLIVDGEATVGGVDVGDDEAGAVLHIRPTKAILHRNAAGDGYAADCVRLDGSRP